MMMMVMMTAFGATNFPAATTKIILTITEINGGCEKNGGYSLIY